MSFKRKLISAAATSALAVAAFTTLAMAQDTNSTSDSDSTQKQEMRQQRGGRGGNRGFGKGMRGGKHGGDRHLMRSLAKLNLSDSQKAQVKTIFENFSNSNQPQREEIRSLGMKKRDGIITADEEARFKEIRTQMKASGDQMRDSILAVLTADQRAQFDQMKAEMKQKRQERRQNRMNRKNQTTAPTEVN